MVPTLTACAVPAFAVGRVASVLAYTASAVFAEALPVFVFVITTLNVGQFADVALTVPAPPLVHAEFPVLPLSGTLYVGLAAVFDDSDVVRPPVCVHAYV